MSGLHQRPFVGLRAVDFTPRPQAPRPASESTGDATIEPVSPDDLVVIRANEKFRERIAALAFRLYNIGKRCNYSAKGREVHPHHHVILDALWEVAERHPDELQVAIMRRTGLRERYQDERGAATQASRTRQA